MAVSDTFSPTENVVPCINEKSTNKKALKPINSNMKNANGFYKNGVVNSHSNKMQNGGPPRARRKGSESFEEPSLFTAFMTGLGFYILMILGYINSIFFTPKVARETHREGYPQLYDPFDMLYMRYIYRRLRDCYNQPICSVPASEVILKDRITKDFAWTFEYDDI